MHKYHHFVAKLVSYRSVVQCLPNVPYNVYSVENLLKTTKSMHSKVVD